MKKIVLSEIKLSLGSFLLFMIGAGVSISLVTSFFNATICLVHMVLGDPTITWIDLLKPLLSIITDSIDALIAGIVTYPIYKFISAQERRYLIVTKLKPETDVTDE